jgi:hypothetical protein
MWKMCVCVRTCMCAVHHGSSAHNRLDMPLLSAEEEARLRQQQDGGRVSGVVRLRALSCVPTRGLCSSLVSHLTRLGCFVALLEFALRVETADKPGTYMRVFRCSAADRCEKHTHTHTLSLGLAREFLIQPCYFFLSRSRSSAPSIDCCKQQQQHDC